MEFFYHPWYMAAGGLLISSPIIIHLINRMRFKRIRWAAMEFLLKSQKRNQRKLIIEQLILLLLRILLVLLAAFLVARFVYGSGGSRGASHVVIVDDTLSMNDRDRADGRTTIAFETAIEQVKELAKNAAEASSAQIMQIYLLSELARPLNPDDGNDRHTPIFDERLSNLSVGKIDAKFTELARRPSLIHASPLLALRKGGELLGEQQAEGQRILHLVSDFRDFDWTAGPDAEKLQEQLKDILQTGINVNLIDVASPVRVARTKDVNHNNNISILDLRAETRVAIEDSEVEFIVTLMNYGQAKDQAFVKVFINGENDLTRDVMLDDLEPGKPREHRFTLRFNRRAAKTSEISDRDTVEQREAKRRLERELFNVRVTISQTLQDEGLMADNVRDMVIEVRKKVPTLVVDGNKPENRGENGDMFHLLSFCAASGIYEVEERSITALEKTDLDLYPSIVLLNVAEIPDPVVKKLRAYVQNGGSLCYFMGEEIKPDHYNSVLFKNDIFPVLLNERPHDPLYAAGMVDPEQRKKERVRLRQLDPTPKILFPKADHKLVRGIVPWGSAFRYLSVNLYWQALPRSRWDPDLKQTEPLIVLPNASTIDRYRPRAIELAQAAVSQTIRLADQEAEYKRFIKPVENYAIQIRNAISANDLYKLGQTFEELLKNQGVKDDPERPNLSELWSAQAMKQLAMEIQDFREQVMFGDPLCVSRQVGKGRVVAYLTTAGTSLRRGVGEDSVQWNNWGAGEDIVTPSYAKFLIDLLGYLISEGEAPQRLLGEDEILRLDPKRYTSKYKVNFFPQPNLSQEGGEGGVRPETLEGNMLPKNNEFELPLTNITKPGVYRVNLTLLGDGPEQERQEMRAFAFNVDAIREGNLKRASRDRLDPESLTSEAGHGKLVLRVPGESYDTFKERQPDASESSLLYLFFILILIVEQAMAVHLSFHTRADQGQMSPSTRPTPQAA